PEAFIDRSALEDHVLLPGHWCVRSQRQYILFNSCTFPREYGLFHLQVPFFHQTGVGRDDIPGSEQDNVTWNNLGGRDILHFGRPQYTAFKLSNVPEGFHGPNSAQFHEKSNEDGNEDHYAHRKALQPSEKDEI